MADPVLRFPPEQKGNPPAPGTTKLAAEPRRRLMAGLRKPAPIAPILWS